MAFAKFFDRTFGWWVFGWWLAGMVILWVIASDALLRVLTELIGGEPEPVVTSGDWLRLGAGLLLCLCLAAADTLAKRRVGTARWRSVTLAFKLGGAIGCFFVGGLGLFVVWPLERLRGRPLFGTPGSTPNEWVPLFGTSNEWVPFGSGDVVICLACLLAGALLFRGWRRSRGGA